MPDAGARTQAEREVAVRRQRFVECGGTLPDSIADRTLFEAILASGEFLPEIFLTHSSVFRTGQDVTVMILTSSTVTASAAGLSLFPWQVGQGRSDMNSLIFSRIYSELVSL